MGRLRAGAAALLLLAAALLAVVLPGSRAGAAEIYPVPADGVFQLDGHGWGHGHGLSQWGAQGGALQGASAAQILSFYYPGATPVAVPDSTLRVLLTGDDGLQLVVAPAQGLTATDEASGATAALSDPSAYRWRVAVDAAGLHVQEQLGAGASWADVALGGRLSLTGPVDLSTPAAMVRMYYPDGSARDYRGELRAVATGSSSLVAVDALALEQYLRGVVPRESPSSFQPAALQAQSVAARTYALHEAQSAGAGSAWDVCDSNYCQVFGGTDYVPPGGGTPVALEQPSTDAAVAATAGEALDYQGAPILSQFSSSDGGWTTYGGEPYLPAQPDPWDGVPGEDVHSWTASLPVAAINAAFGGAGLGRLVDIRITGRDGNGDWGGRVLTAVLDGVDAAGNATQVAVTGQQLLDAYPWPEHADGLRSVWFTVHTPADSTVTARSSAPTLAGGPGVPGVPDAATLTATFSNTGTASWPLSSLQLAATGSWPLTAGAGTATDLTTPGAASAAPGDSVQVTLPLSADRAPPGSYPISYRLTYAGQPAFGAAVTWQVQVSPATLHAVPTGALPVLALTPGATASAALSFTNTGTVAWPAATVRLGTSLPRDRTSVFAAPNWLSANRVAPLQAALPGSTSSVSLSARAPLGTAPGVYQEGFEPVWDGRAWLGGALTVPVVVAGPGASPGAALVQAASPGPLQAGPRGTGSILVELRDTGSSAWTVGHLALAAHVVVPSGAAAPLAPAAAQLSAVLGRPGAGTVAPGQTGIWRVPVDARAASVGSAVVSLALGSDPIIAAVPLSVTPFAPSVAVVSAPGTLTVPAGGSVTVPIDVRNTGDAALPVGGSFQLAVAAPSPLACTCWPAPDRPAALRANRSVPGSRLLEPGEIGRFLLTLSGGAAGSGTLVVRFVYAGTGLPGPALSLPYTVR